MSHKHDQEGKLVYMTNQIGKFFATQKEMPAPKAIAAHLKKFWDPRMLSKIIAHSDAGGEGLDPNSRAAVEILKKERQTAA